VLVECDGAGAPLAVGLQADSTPAGSRQLAVGSPPHPRQVAAIQSRWRIDDEWWRDRPVSRLYYALLLEDGAVVTVFQDLEDNTWWQQRY